MSKVLCLRDIVIYLGVHASFQVILFVKHKKVFTLIENMGPVPLPIFGLYHPFYANKF